MNVPAGDTEIVALQVGADMTYRRFPDGTFNDWHNAPGVQYVIALFRPDGDRDRRRKKKKCSTLGIYCR
ncbi:MAG: hypothetical protein Ct9H300mP11_27580 [Chloroflexota bacterium]|nr:MAG: hypothetical protein Ct9H300mP11_27580 [Chloroflexota bacterium]